MTDKAYHELENVFSVSGAGTFSFIGGWKMFPVMVPTDYIAKCDKGTSGSLI
ncbi:MAG TPA: hypothetical protein PKK43_05380 [Spirochaetota bacterium]|nr:hypothetical protein [Spirochaetota bacterium]